MEDRIDMARLNGGKRRPLRVRETPPRPPVAKKKRGPNRAFTDDEVREIRREMAAGKPGRVVAQERNVSLRTIYDISGGISYRDVTD